MYRVWQAVAHVRCYQQFHPPPPKADNKEEQRRKRKAEQKHKDDQAEAAKREGADIAAQGSSKEAASVGAEAGTPSTPAASAPPDGLEAASGVGADGKGQLLAMPKLANGEQNGDADGSTAQQPAAGNSKKEDASMQAAKTDSELADSMGGLLLDWRMCQPTR
jgi:hypothetical protein